MINRGGVLQWGEFVTRGTFRDTNKVHEPALFFSPKSVLILLRRLKNEIAASDAE
jgi:hypothetical protein